MLNIKDGNDWHVWHMGEPLPDLKGPVVKFYADGDELEEIIEALESTEPKED